MSNQILINILISTATYLLVAVSFGEIYRVSKCFHFAHASIYALAAYCAYVFYKVWSLPLIISAVLATGLTVALGWSINRYVYYHLQQRGGGSSAIMILSLGVMIVLQNAISIIFGDQTLSISDYHVNEGVQLFGGIITTNQIIMICTSGVLIISLYIIRRFTVIGKMMNAVACDSLLGTIVGVPVNCVVGLSYVIGSAIVAVTAILLSFSTDLTPAMGLRAFLMGVVAYIIGGKTLLGVLLGAAFLSLIQNVSVFILPGQWQDTIAFGVLLVILIFRPKLSALEVRVTV